MLAKHHLAADSASGVPCFRPLQPVSKLFKRYGHGALLFIAYIARTPCGYLTLETRANAGGRDSCRAEVLPMHSCSTGVAPSRVTHCVFGTDLFQNKAAESARRASAWCVPLSLLCTQTEKQALLAPCATRPHEGRSVARLLRQEDRRATRARVRGVRQEI